MVAASRDDRQVRLQEVIADAAHVREAALETPCVEIIEEQSAHAARFVPVLQEEVPVAPVLVLGIHGRAERSAGALRRAMPVQYILVERVVRREIEAAAEP